MIILEMASSLRAAQCFVWSFFIGDHPRNQENGKGKSENRKSENQEIGIGKESENRNEETEPRNRKNDEEIRTIKTRRITTDSNGLCAAVTPFA
jgi:hypothetical protein